MRSRSLAAVIAGAALAVGSSAQAGPLIGATWTSTTQGIFLSLTKSGAVCTDVDPDHTQTSITCPTAGNGATGSATATSYSVSLTAPLFEFRTFTTGGAVINNVYTHAKLSGGASISGNDSGAAATMGVPGMVTVKIAGHVAKGGNASKQAPGPTTLLKVPLSVGKQGTVTGYFFLSNQVHYITVDFYAWTPHTLTFTGLTSRYAPLPTPTVVAMGSFALTPMGGGTVLLVSPSKISIDGPLNQRRTASFTSLNLTYAPEPGTVLLLGAGAGALVFLRSRKRG